MQKRKKYTKNHKQKNGDWNLNLKDKIIQSLIKKKKNDNCDHSLVNPTLARMIAESLVEWSNYAFYTH